MKIGFTAALNQFVPQISRIAQRVIHGVKRLLSLCTPEDADYRIKKDNVERDDALYRGERLREGAERSEASRRDDGDPGASASALASNLALP